MRLSGQRRASQLIAIALLFAASCAPAAVGEGEQPRASPPADQAAFTPAPTPSGAAPVARATETPPPRQKITITSPDEGAMLPNPFTLAGSVAVTPVDKTLRYRVTNAFGDVIAEDVTSIEGTPGEAGSFRATITYALSLAGPSRIQIIAGQDVAEQAAQIPELRVRLPEGVSLTINGVASQARAEIVPRKPNIRFPIDWNGWPRHLRLSFDGDQLTESFDPRQRQILILPLQDYQALFRGAEGQSFTEAIQAFQTLVAERPAVLKEDPLLLPASDLSQAMRAQVRYLEFDGGSGVRFLTHLTQEIRPLTASSLIYTFQGVTRDGQYYIAAYFPVTTTALPATPTDISQAERDAFKRDYLAYVDGIAQRLNAQPKSVTPSLDALDAMITSLQISDALLTPPRLSASEPIGRATDLLNIRAGPGTRFRIISRLAAGDSAELLARDATGGWLRIRSASGVTGWVSRAYIDTAFDIRQLPVQP